MLPYANDDGAAMPLINPVSRELARDLRASIGGRRRCLKAMLDTIAKFLRLQMKGANVSQLSAKLIEDVLRHQAKLRSEDVWGPEESHAVMRHGGSVAGRPPEGFVRDVWDGTSERAKDIAHYVNQAGGPTGMIMKAMNFADIARMSGDRIMQKLTQAIVDFANERVQRQKEIYEREDAPQIRKLSEELRIKSPGHVDAVLDYMDFENYLGSAGSSPIVERNAAGQRVGENKWVSESPDEPGHRQIHNEFSRLRQMWNALPDSSKEMVKGLRDYYKGRYDDIREATLRDLIKLRGLVPAEAIDAMVKLVSEGRDSLSPAELDTLRKHATGFDGYDRPTAQRTADNNQFRDHLSDLRIPEFRKIAGVYYPMMRRGNYVVQFYKLDRFAQGGIERNSESGRASFRSPGV